MSDLSPRDYHDALQVMQSFCTFIAEVVSIDHDEQKMFIRWGPNTSAYVWITDGRLTEYSTGDWIVTEPIRRAK